MFKAETLAQIRAKDTTKREVTFFGDLPGALFGAIILMAAIIILCEALLAFRLYNELMGQVPNSGLGSWLFSLSGVPADPFRGYETAPAYPNEAVFEFAVLMAMEVYLVWGLLCLAALYYGRRWAAQNAPNPWIRTIDVGPVVAELSLLDKALASAWTDVRTTTRRVARTNWKAEATSAKASLYHSLQRLEHSLVHPMRRGQHT